MKEKLFSSLISLGVIISMVFGVYFWATNEFASAESFKQFKRQVDQQFLYDKLERIEERIFKYKKELKLDPNNEIIQDELRLLEQNKQKIEKDIDLLYENYKKD